jgi:hypothetical protein
MPRNVASSVENNFSRGLLTEASGLNFPENACTDTDNCHFDIQGEVRRRFGIDYETSANTKTIARAGSAISTYLWKNVGGDGNTALWVVQVGETLYFYDALNSSSISAGALATTVSLTSFMPAGAPSPKTVECQYSDGLGYLFVTHPSLDTFYVSFDTTTNTATATQIDLQIRDFVGITEAVAVDNRPSALSATHKYNLANQGWPFSSYDIKTSSTSITPNTGALTFTVAAAGPWVAGQSIYIWSKATRQGKENNNLHFVQGTVTSYAGTTLVIDSTAYGPDTGASARTDWQIGSGPALISMFDQVMSFYPSNADVWWMFKDANDEFNPRKTAANVSRGGTRAPLGHYVLDLYDQDRATVSGITGPTLVSLSYNRASTSAFFSGRVFYAGIPFTGYTANIYFSKILTPGSTAEFGQCYQQSDPTSETLFDLLPNDGGVIPIPEAGTIIKLWSMQGGLVVFATNGVWQITGSTGLGFTANDYTVRQISSIRAISATSFVNVGGYPAWWSSEGAYLLTPNGPDVTLKSLTDETILSFFAEIPESSKKQARGFFNLITKKVHWLYRSTQAGDVDETYEYDKVLIWNARTAAFNPWTIADSDVKVHAVVVVDNATGALVESTVVDNALNTVVDDAGNTVVSYSLSTTATSPTFKYLVSSPNGASANFTVAEERNTNYLDWETYDAVGVDYDSYFISGYKVHGQGQKKFQANYVFLFNKAIPSQYTFQALWDYANTADSNSWSSSATQTINQTEDKYDIRRRRIKVRGEGYALQFKVSSVSGQPFEIVGWSTWETGNANI